MGKQTGREKLKSLNKEGDGVKEEYGDGEDTVEPRLSAPGFKAKPQLKAKIFF